MKYVDEKCINKLMLGQISKKEFINRIHIKEDCIEDEIREMLEYAYKKCLSENLDIAIYLIFKFELFNNKDIEILNNLIISDWHEQHENIAMLLQKAKSESSVQYLYKSIKLKLDYLEWDDNYAFQVKCIWALGDIGNEEAKVVLQELTKSNIEIISKNAIKQIQRIE